MKILVCGLLFGIVLGMFGVVSIALSRYIQKVEDDNNCKSCDQYNECFAKKKFFWMNSSWLDEMMLITYLKVRKTCKYHTHTSVNECIVYLSFSCILMFILFWSKGTSVNTYILAVVVELLLLLSVVDWNTQYIPLECNIGIFICGLMQIFADFSNWLEYAIGLIAVSGFLLLVNLIATPILRKKYEGEMQVDQVIGDGDVKLMAATGLLLGWKLNFVALGIGCIIGSIIHILLMRIKGSERQFALGPYLSLGVFITMICGQQLISWYLNLIGIVPVN